MQIQSNGSTFNCRVDGERGPWVMLSHGLANDMSMWDELAVVLRDRYRVLRYDARGHGGSLATVGDYDLSLLAADATGILDALGIGQAHFVGLSMSGMIGLGLLLDHPRRIRSAVIADTLHTATPEFTQAWRTRAEAVRRNGIEAILAPTVERWSSADLAARNPAVVERMQRMIRNTAAAGYCGCAAALAGVNYGPRLHEIRQPVLVLCGDEDQSTPPQHSREMHAMIEGSRYLELGRAGHLSNLEQPEIFNRAVTEFLAEAETTV